MPAAIIAPVMIGAAIGAVSAAVQGGNILKGALFGALGGAVGGAISGAFGGAAGSTAGAVGGEVAGAVGGEVGGAVAGEVAGATATGLGEAAAASGALGAGEVSPFFAVDAVAPELVGSGMQTVVQPGMQAAGMMGGMQEPVSSLGLGAPVGADTGLVGVPPPPNPGPQTFLGSLFENGTNMVNSRLGATMIGQTLQGYSLGKMQEAQIQSRREDTRDARANARFGNVGSRMNAYPMYGPATYKN